MIGLRMFIINLFKKNIVFTKDYKPTKAEVWQYVVWRDRICTVSVLVLSEIWNQGVDKNCDKNINMVVAEEINSSENEDKNSETINEEPQDILIFSVESILFTVIILRIYAIIIREKKKILLYYNLTLLLV